MNIKDFKAGDTVYCVFKERSHFPFSKRECTVTKVGNKYVFTDNSSHNRFKKVYEDEKNFLSNPNSINYEELLFKTEAEADIFIEIEEKKKEIINYISHQNLSKCSDEKIREIYETITRE